LDSDVLDVIKQQVLMALKRQGEDAQTVAGREWEIWHFKGHPYGRDPLRGLTTIPALTRNDLMTFISQYFVPSNMVVTVAGDIALDALTAGLDQVLFKDFPDKDAASRKLPIPAQTSPVLALIHKPGQVQSQIIMGMGGITRDHPDFWKLSLLTQILGGSDSLMYKRLRDDLGLIYAGWFGQTYKWQAGMLMGYIGCRADKTRESLVETAALMRSLQSNVPREALEQKRLDALNSFIFNVDTPQELVEVYGRYWMRHEPLDTLERIQDAFLQANAAELQKLAQRYLEPGQLQIMVVADKDTPIKKESGRSVSLETDLKDLAEELLLPYKEIELR
jgi:zinc protease